MNPRPAYLTPAEAARKLGVSERTIERRINSGELPALHLTDRLRRVEARAIDPAAPEPVVRCRARLGTLAISREFRISRKTVERLARAGHLPMTRRGMHWSMPRRRLLTWICDHTTGPDL